MGARTPSLSTNQKLIMNELSTATNLMLRRLLAGEGDCKRDYNKECGYPDRIEAHQYREAYERDGVAARVCDVYPDECWAMLPEVIETEELDETPWEKKFNELNDNEGLDLLSTLHRMDKISGIGQFGIMLLGLDDGADLSTPVLDVDLKTGKLKDAAKEHNLLYLRCFDQSLVQISQYETNKNHPRYGQPVLYDVALQDPLADKGAVTGRGTIHWSRVLHFADNRISSEICGQPRMQSTWNRLHDLKKIGGGSGEMFWRGGFPGYSLESPADGTLELDIPSMRAEFERFSNTLQRYMAFQGVTTKVLSPNVASPEDHLNGQLKLISITIGVPMRVFVGSEEAKISSTQDSLTWNKRLGRRQETYITPKIIKPTLSRLMALKVLPRIAKPIVHWPDLNTSTDMERGESAAKMATAIATYVGGGCDQMIPPLEFMIHVLNIHPTIAKLIMEAMEKYTPQFIAAAPDNGGGAANAPGKGDKLTKVGKKAKVAAPTKPGGKKTSAK